MRRFLHRALLALVCLCALLCVASILAWFALPLPLSWARAGGRYWELGRLARSWAVLSIGDYTRDEPLHRTASTLATGSAYGGQGRPVYLDSQDQRGGSKRDAIEIVTANCVPEDAYGPDKATILWPKGWPREMLGHYHPLARVVVAAWVPPVVLALLPLIYVEQVIAAGIRRRRSA